MSDQEAYVAARFACEVARNVLREHDFAALCAAIRRTETLGPLLVPTLYREKHRAMEEDRKVFEAAARFLGVWKGEG